MRAKRAIGGGAALGIAVASAAILMSALSPGESQGGRSADGPRSREGALKVGDEAPDFTLRTTDGTAEVQLSSYMGECPVALIFGSYT